MNRALSTLKPPRGAQVNWRHPLARGLVCVVPFNEGAGMPTMYTPHGAVPGTHSGLSGAQRWERSRRGIGFKLSSGNSGDLRWLYQTQFDSSKTDQTFFGLATCDGAAGTIRTLMQWNRNAAGQMGQLHLTAANVLGAAGNGATDNVVGTTTVSADNAVRSFAYTSRLMGSGASGVLHTLYLDSKVEATASGAFSAIDVQRNQLWTQDTAGNRTWAGIVVFLASWNRALSAAEIVQLHADPFVLFSPPFVSSRVVIAAGASPAAIAGAKNSRLRVGIGIGVAR